MRTSIFFFAIVSTVLTGVCQGQEPLPAPGRTHVLSGKVEWRGEIPPPVEIDVTANPPVAAMWPNGRISYQETEVSPDRGLAGVLVFVSKGAPAGEWPVPQERVVVESRRGVFSPNPVVLRVGQPWGFRHFDDFGIAPHFKSRRNGDFNRTFGSPGYAEWDPLVAAEPTGAILQCDCCPWMTTRVAILDHPFWAMTGTDGRWTITGLPDGPVELTAWHPRWDKRVLTIEDVGNDGRNLPIAFQSK